MSLGSLIARYFVIPLYDINHKLWPCGLFGWILCLIGIIGVYVIIIKVKQAGIFSVSNPINQSTHYNSIIAHDDVIKDSAVGIESKDILKLRIRAWLIMIGISVGAGNFQTFFSQMTVPLMDTFNITEFESNLLLSSSPIMSFLFVPLWSYITNKYGFHLLSYLFVTSMISFISSIVIIILCYNEIIISNDGLLNPIPWVAMFIENIGVQLYWSNGWELLYNCTPKHLHATISSITTVMYVGFAFVEMQLFGILATEMGNYNGSMIMVAILPVLGLLITLMVHFEKATNSLH